MAVDHAERQTASQISVYIHIPFCRSKCPYCGFVSVVADDEAVRAYVDALRTELGRSAGWLRERGASVPTLYIGGGTPTRLPCEVLSDLVGKALRLLPMSDEPEVTVEANPGTVDDEYLLRLRRSGVNRLSLGVQAFDDKNLRTLGRIHTAAEAVRAVAAARRAGFDRLSVDLMYAISGQTLEQWRDSLHKAVELSLSHVSCYSLTYEEGTELARRAADGSLTPVDEDLELRMFWLAEEVLGQGGLRRYEISNFAVPGQECRHNLVYWRGGEYLGLGCAAHSFVDGERWANVARPRFYTQLASQGSPVVFRERPTVHQRLAERMMLGLRTAEGVCVAEALRDAPDELRVEVLGRIRGLQQLGLLRTTNGRAYLTRKGLPVADSVVETFF